MPNEEMRREQRRLMLEAVERRAVAARERGMPRLRREREERELEQDMSFDMSMLGLTKRERYDLLGPEKWREHIDGRHHHWGREVYIEGLHRLHIDPHAQKRAVADPEYNNRMMRADSYVSSTFNFGDFTVEHYQVIHTLVSPESHDFGNFPRSYELTLTFAAFHDSVEALEAENDPYVERFNIAGPQQCQVVLREIHKALAEVDRLLTEHYQSLRFVFEEDERLRIGARTHRLLENLHPYVDYNTRTNRLVLNRLLVDAGLTPSILHEPLSVHHRTLEHWVEHIREGQQLWRRLIREFRRI